MEVKIPIWRVRRYRKLNEIIQIENDDELYLDNDYVASSDPDE